MVKTEYIPYNLWMFADLAEVAGVWACHRYLLGSSPTRPWRIATVLDLSKPLWYLSLHPLLRRGKEWRSPCHLLVELPWLIGKLLSLHRCTTKCDWDVTTLQTTWGMPWLVKMARLLIPVLCKHSKQVSVLRRALFIWEPSSDTLASFGNSTVLYSMTEDKPGGVTSPGEFYEPTC